MILVNQNRLITRSKNSFELRAHKLGALSLYDNFMQKGAPACEHPIYLASRKVYVPCGHCETCARKAKRDWIVRCNLEFQYWKTGEFLTLTFSDDYLGDTSYKVVQDFLKRLRKNFKCKFKYFVAYENGEKSGRAHYHLLVFGFHRPYPIDPYRWNSILADHWQHGIVQALPMTNGNIPYVCGYVQKKLVAQLGSKDLPQGLSRREYTRLNVWSLNDVSLSLAVKRPQRRAEFVKMSKGLGFCWLNNLKSVKAVLKKGYFRFKKYRFAIPRALLLKLEQLGIDWLCPDAYYKYLEDRELSQKRDRFSFQNVSCLFTRKDVYNEPNRFIDFVHRWINDRSAHYRQIALNSRMRV